MGDEHVPIGSGFHGPTPPSGTDRPAAGVTSTKSRSADVRLRGPRFCLCRHARAARLAICLRLRACDPAQEGRQRFLLCRLARAIGSPILPFSSAYARSLSRRRGPTSIAHLRTDTFRPPGATPRRKQYRYHAEYREAREHSMIRAPVRVRGGVADHPDDRRRTHGRTRAAARKGSRDGRASPRDHAHPRWQ